MHFFTLFPYLLFSLLFLILFITGLIIAPSKYRHSVLVSATLSAPTSLASFVFVPYYWDPKRILNYEIGMEDIIFSFASGGIIWLYIILLLNLFFSVNMRNQVLLKQYAKFIFFGCALYLLWLLTGIAVMTATVITVLIIGLWIIKQKPRYLIISLCGALGYTVIYTAYLKFFLVIFPDFINQWSSDTLSGIFIFGLPAEEIIWAFATGAVWPLIVAYLLNMNVQQMRPIHYTWQPKV